VCLKTDAGIGIGIGIGIDIGISIGIGTRLFKDGYIDFIGPI